MIFYRHPQPDVQAGLCYGRLDVDVHPNAITSIRNACSNPPHFSSIVSSPAKRALALAEPLAATTRATLTTDAQWMEMDFGAWEGRLWSEIDRAESDPWASDPFHLSPPNGETFASVVQRVKSALAECLPNTAIIAHAGPIRAARMILTNMSFEAAFSEPVPFATPITFENTKVA
jgi:alpha-ribazole phosphatase